LRHPRLKIFSAETGIGWVPFLLEAMDYQWHENLLPDVKRDVWKAALPSEIFRRNFYLSFWFEQWGPAHAIELLGQDNVMFETDFPHGTALTDRVTEQVVSTLASLAPEIRKKVLRENAVRLYDLDP
jgi:predicted TIM-barrel fold metal-dependent hydrolase